MTVTTDKFHKWDSCLALSVASASVEDVGQLVGLLRGLPAGKKKIPTQKSLHLSLYRGRGYLKGRGGVKAGFGRIREACTGKPTGRAFAVGVAIKIVGSDYDDMRVLAGPGL